MKHAFLSKEKTIAKNGKSLGIEHAKDEDIQQALSDIYTPKTDSETHISIPLEVLIEGRLIGHPKAKERRTRLGEFLKIGYTNGKQLQKRLSIFQIHREQLEAAILQLDLEDNKE